LGFGSCCDGDALNAGELKTSRHNSLASNTSRDFVEGLRLRLTSCKLRNRCNVVPFLVALYDDIELAWQWIVLSLHFTPFELRSSPPVAAVDRPDRSQARFVGPYPVGWPPVGGLFPGGALHGRRMAARFGDAAFTGLNDARTVLVGPPSSRHFLGRLDLVIELLPPQFP
jgi:hypothetical protein